MDRRGFLKYAGATVAVVGVSALGAYYLLRPQPQIVSPTTISSSSLAKSTPSKSLSTVSTSTASIQAYSGVSGAVHQSNFDRLSGQGYRIISLSVYGEPTSPLYAAVWAQRPGAAWVEVHGVNATDYQSFFNTWTAKGYAPTIISATGLVANAVFAAVFEQGISGSQWLARNDMTSGQATNSSTFQYQNALASKQNMILQSFAIYGNLNDRRYAAIWQANPGFVKWHVHPADTATNYQT
ncbi:MAG TPA: twin-arginine translocation signal domain-containing protein, partial [Candidatus Bathyarchaeia archaeon]|nr:twin-arginine translocation signal domain-containing protein [Candidatus Bathyarchaeia archaeon]